MGDKNSNSFSSIKIMFNFFNPYLLLFNRCHSQFRKWKSISILPYLHLRGSVFITFLSKIIFFNFNSLSLWDSLAVNFTVWRSITKYRKICYLTLVHWMLQYFVPNKLRPVTTMYSKIAVFNEVWKYRKVLKLNIK